MKTSEVSSESSVRSVSVRSLYVRSVSVRSVSVKNILSANPSGLELSVLSFYLNVT